MQRIDTVQLAIVCVAEFVVWAGFGAILPSLPVFLQGQAHASLTLIGVIAAGYSVGTFVFASPLGRLSDAIGRKPVIVLGVALYAVATALFMVTKHPGWFILFRVLEGIGSAAVGPAGQAFVAEISPPSQRSRAYGWLTTAQFGGLGAGPMVGSVLYSIVGSGIWAFYSIFLFGSVVSAVSAIALAVVLREPPHTAHRRQVKIKRPPLRALLTAPVVGFIVIAFTGHYAMGAFDVIWSIYLRDLGATMQYINYTWVAFSLPMLFSWLGGRIADRGNRFQLLYMGYGFSCLAWIIYGLSKDFTVLIVMNALEGIAFAISFPAKQAFLIDVSPPRWLGTITGMESSAMQMAMLLGSLTAPLLYGAIGGATLSLSGVLSAIGLIAASVALKHAWDRVSQGLPASPRMVVEEAVGGTTSSR